MREETPVPYIVENPTVITEVEKIVLEQAAKIYKRLAIHGDVLTNPETVSNWLKAELIGEPSEVFGVLWLDTRHRVIAFQKLFNGTIDGATIHSREVIRNALAHNAAAAILVHNHPSHDATPSRADVSITERLSTALGYIDVKTLDHIVIGDTVVSMAERGLM